MLIFTILYSESVRKTMKLDRQIRISHKNIFFGSKWIVYHYK